MLITIKFNEIVKPLALSNNSLFPTLNHNSSKIWAKFDGSCLKKEKVIFTHKQMVSTYIVYENNLCPFVVSNDFMFGNSSFGTVKLIENGDVYKYNYSEYDIALGGCGNFLLSYCSGFSKSLIMFVGDMSSSAYIDNKNKDILIPGKGPTGGLDDTTLTTVKEYSINFTEQQKIFCLNLYYYVVNSYIIVNSVEIYNSNQTILRQTQPHYV